MRLIPTKHLRENSYMGLDLLDIQGRLLLPKDKKITTSGVNIIKKLGVSNVYVYDEWSFDESENIHIVKKLEKFIKRIERLRVIRLAISEGKANQTNIKEVEMIAERIVDEVCSSPEVGKIEYEAPKLHHTEIEKNLYIAVMSVILGVKLNLERRDLINLCMSALLKDVGLLIIELIKKEGKIEPPARYEHPLVGGRYLMKYKLDTDIAAAVMQHTELEDGTGLPRGLKGDKICLNAKIISTINTFYEICEKHDPYEDQNKKLENNLFKMLQNGDKELIRKFIFNTNIYKVDTLVKLNTGDIAVISKHNKYNPFRPTVKIIKGNVYKNEELINLRIARSVRLDRVVYYVR